MGFFAQLEKYAASHQCRPGSVPEYAPRGRNDFKARVAAHRTAAHDSQAKDLKETGQGNSSQRPCNRLLEPR